MSFVQAATELLFPADHPTAEGHFPGQSDHSGRRSAEPYNMRDPAGSGALGNRVGQVFWPRAAGGNTVTIAWQTGPNATKFECHLKDADKLVLSGVVRPLA